MTLLFVRVLAMTLATCWVFPATAVVVTGNFQGIAQDSRIDAMSPNPGNFDGQLVTAKFRFDTAGLIPRDGTEPNAPNFVWSFLSTGSLELTFHAVGRVASFGATPESLNAVSAEYIGGEPFFGFLADYIDPYHSASLYLGGALFEALDLSSFAPGPITIANSSAYFFDSRDFGASVALTLVTFDTLLVPEPGSAFLFVIALVVVAGGRNLSRCRTKPSADRDDFAPAKIRYAQALAAFEAALCQPRCERAAAIEPTVRQVTTSTAT